jgi:hypothetical protein
VTQHDAEEQGQQGGNGARQQTQEKARAGNPASEVAQVRPGQTENAESDEPGKKRRARQRHDRLKQHRLGAE